MREAAGIISCMDHYWESLEGQNWFAGADIYRAQVARAADDALFVELGSWKGRSASCMGVEIINSGKRIRFYAVDNWEGFDNAAYRADSDVKGGTLYEAFLKNVEPVRHVVNPLRHDSAQAASMFSDHSVDFLYVDASHTYDGVTKDLEAWWPKVKHGGVVAGDDWLSEEQEGSTVWGIQKAVSQFAARNRLAFTVFPGWQNSSWLQWQMTKP
jgi:predicted O-methyltransferase YrrM